MKKRTRVIAYIYLAFSVYMFIPVLLVVVTSVPWLILDGHELVSLLWAVSQYWWMWAGLLIGGLQWPFWWALLKQKAWVWKVLVAVFSAHALERAYTLATAPAYYAAHPEIERPVVAFALTFLWALIWVGIPMWALLTDPPARWTSARDQLQSPINADGI